MQKFTTCVETRLSFRENERYNAYFKGKQRSFQKMTRKKSKNKQKMKIIAKERIDTLFQLSKDHSKGDDQDKTLSRRYIFLARKIAMRIRTPLKLEYKRNTCRNCNSLLVPGQNSRVRLKGKKKNAHVIVTCLHCGNIRRYHYHRSLNKRGER